MITSLKAWFKDKFSGADTSPPPSTQSRSSYRQHLVAMDKPSPPTEAQAEAETKDVDAQSHGTIESLGPGKNVYVQNPYVREELGTHESLKIVDQSLVDGEEPDGIDPYNTGRFDKSRKWEQRSRK